MFYFLLLIRPQRRKSTGRRIRQRSTSPRQYPSENRRTSAQRRPALRYIPHPASEQRVRVEDTGPLLRDGLDTSEGYRGEQTQGGYPERCATDRYLQEGMPVDIRVGDQRQVIIREDLLARKYPQCKYIDTTCFHLTPFPFPPLSLIDYTLRRS